MRRTHRTALLAAATIALLVTAVACVPEMPVQPPQAVAVACEAIPGRTCTTGVVQAPALGGSPQGSVTVNDNGALAGTVSAAVTTPTINCAEFSPSGLAELGFDFVQTNVADPTGLTKTAVLSETVVTELSAESFDVCFQTTQPFPALRPSEFAADLAAGDFSNNNVQIAQDGEPDQYTGLLLPCSLGFGVPCIVSRQLVPDGGPFDFRFVATVRTAVGDPKLRF